MIGANIFPFDRYVKILQSKKRHVPPWNFSFFLQKKLLRAFDRYNKSSYIVHKKAQTKFLTHLYKHQKKDQHEGLSPVPLK
jgi:hypothetical protein